MFIRVMEDQVGMRYLVDFWARNWEDMSGLRGPGGCWEIDIEAVTLERRQRDRAETGIAMTVGLIKEACWRKRRTQVGRQKWGPPTGSCYKNIYAWIGTDRKGWAFWVKYKSVENFTCQNTFFFLSETHWGNPELLYTSPNFGRTPWQSKCLAISSASRKTAYMNRAQRPVLWVRKPGCMVGTQERHVGIAVVGNSSSFQVVVWNSLGNYIQVIYSLIHFFFFLPLVYPYWIYSIILLWQNGTLVPSFFVIQNKLRLRWSGADISEYSVFITADT